MSAATSQRKGPGCLFWGCLTVGILIAGIGGCTGFVLYSLRNMVLSLTVEEPAPLPIADPSDEQVDQIRTAIQEYQTAVESDQSGALELTAEEINALIADTPDLAGRVYVDIDGDQLSAQGSIPLEGIPGFSDRYINGSFSLSLSLEDEELIATITDFDIEGHEIPDEFKQQVIEEFQDVDLLEEMSDPQAAEDLLDAVDRIEIEDGKLILIRE